MVHTKYSKTRVRDFSVCNIPNPRDFSVCIISCSVTMFECLSSRVVLTKYSKTRVRDFSVCIISCSVTMFECLSSLSKDTEIENIVS